VKNIIHLCGSIGKLERKKSFASPLHSRRDNIKTGCNEIDCEDEKWIRLAEGRVQWWALVCMALKLCVSYRTWTFSAD
jgi:hypothetical protein